jgi:uncharacterized paraquat-inducible protein A
MGEGPNKNQKTPKSSVHICPQCGFSIDLIELGLPGGATGFMTCPKCDWSAPINIKIIDKEPAD